MARKTPEGEFILSAGEIGSYTVCPEQWKLKAVDRVRGKRARSIEEGQKLHEQWAKTYDESVDLARGARYIILFLLVASVFYLLMRGV